MVRTSVYPNNSDNLGEMEKFLETHKFTKLTQEEIENHNRSIIRESK
jgi:hypothetical protein